MGRAAFSEQDRERLGTVGSIRRMDNDTFAMIDHGGMLDLSQQTFMVPAERKALDRRGRVMLLGLTQQDTNAMPQMDAAEGQEISAGEIVRTSEACQQQ